MYPALLVITMPYGRVFFHASAFFPDAVIETPKAKFYYGKNVLGIMFSHYIDCEFKIP